MRVQIGPGRKRFVRSVAALRRSRRDYQRKTERTYASDGVALTVVTVRGGLGLRPYEFVHLLLHVVDYVRLVHVIGISVV